MTKNRLKIFAKKAPTEPGIYIFTGDGGKKLYIGKASKIRVRLLSYLKTTDPRVLKMISLAAGIKILKTNSEIEALILESQYIKKHKPVFNIMMRDDKQFGFVGFTKEKYPKIFLTHQPTKSVRDVGIVGDVRDENISNKRSGRTPQTSEAIKQHIGPFTDIGALKTTLRYLRRIFPYCTCKKPHNNFCLNYHIGKCPGFCCLKDSPERSRRIAEEKEYKKNIRAIKDILNGKKTFLLKGLEKEMIKLGKKAASSLTGEPRQWREKFEEAIELRTKMEKIKRVFENTRIIHNADARTPNNLDTLSEFKKILKLPDVPNRIEGYDIANIQGKYAAGAMVVFKDGKPSKKEYRKFKIHAKKSPNDTAMLQEILTRRFNHPEWPTPRLVLIDGGKGQLNAAYSVIKNIPVPVIALTKDKKHQGSKIYVIGKKNPISLSKLSVNTKNLLLRIDAEAHRFAILYYRRLHRSSVEKR